ncbi:MAG: hypothetical protein ACI9WU_004473 [Myxococcota bacterium]
MQNKPPGKADTSTTENGTTTMKNQASRTFLLGLTLSALCMSGCALETGPIGGGLSSDEGAGDWTGGTSDGSTGMQASADTWSGPGAPSEDASVSADTNSWTGGGDGGDTGDTGGTGSWDGGGGTSGGSTTGGTGAPPTTGPNGECLASCTGSQCGPDGCGGSCGWCGGGDSCQAGSCVAVPGCTPECAGKMVGIDDGCGGLCSGSGMGIGLVPGGAQDAAYFTSQVKAGAVPTPDLLPLEGWLTQHGTALPAPMTDRLVTLHGFVGLFYDPAVGEPTVALQLGMNSGLSAEAVEEGQFNLSVVIDRSGSMAENNKMEFVRDGLIQMLDILDSGDIFSIVSYSTTAKVVLAPTPVTEENREMIKNLILDLKTGGKTNLHGGLKLGYEQVMKNAANNALTPRVVLLSDGIANEGITDIDAILAFSKSYNDVGIGLTTIGVGQDLQFDMLHLLASQGSGNFFFLDSAEKLAQVFTEELEYLLTPVADNLKIWMTLPDGFGVEDVYGFEYKETNGEFHLLGPSAQYTVSDGEVVDQPPGGGDEEPNVAVSTLFASKKNGLLMVKLASPAANLLADIEGASLGTVYYSYELVDSGETEAFDIDLEVGSLEFNNDGAGGFHYFTGATMQRNFCILRSGLAMKQASSIFHEQGEDGLNAAITTLAQARTFCTGINVQLNDAALIEDIALLSTLMDNICGDSCLDPDGQ